MKTLSNAVVINGVAYTINATEAKKISELLGISDIANNVVKTTTESPKAETKTEPVEPKTDKKAPVKSTKKVTRTVGSLEQSNEYVRTVKDAFISSKARYAIQMTAQTMGGTKLGKGDKVYESCHKDDKYVQVYKFPTTEDATKFMDEQVMHTTRK